MRKSHWTPSIIPSDNDRTVYLVAEDFGKLGRAWAKPSTKLPIKPVRISFQAYTIIRSASSPSTLKSDGRRTFPKTWLTNCVGAAIHRREICHPPFKIFVERHVGHGRRQLTLRL